MFATVYAIKYTPTPEEMRLGIVEPLATLGYPVTWTLTAAPDARKISIDIADGSKIWEDDHGCVWIDEGSNPGKLRTFNGMPTLTIATYYGNVDKPLRIMSIA